MFVTWTNLALDDLAAFYVTLSLGEQDDISRTVQRVNAELSLDPESFGESREANCRVWCVGRLAVSYAIRRASGQIIVYNCTLLPGSPR